MSQMFSDLVESICSSSLSSYGFCLGLLLIFHLPHKICINFFIRNMLALKSFRVSFTFVFVCDGSGIICTANTISRVLKYFFFMTCETLLVLFKEKQADDKCVYGIIGICVLTLQQTFIRLRILDMVVTDLFQLLGGMSIPSSINAFILDLSLNFSFKLDT